MSDFEGTLSKISVIISESVYGIIYSAVALNLQNPA